MKQVLTLIMITFLVINAAKGQDLNSFFKEADAFFAKHVSDRKIQYGAIKEDPKELTDLTDFIASADVSSYSEVQLKAFYII